MTTPRELLLKDQQRSLKQNNALHLFCKKLADELNGKGLYMQLVLKPTYELRWDTKTVKEHLFKPVMRAMKQKKSTTELNRKEVSEVHEQLMLMLKESPKTSDIDYIDFPSEEQTEEYFKSFNQ